MSGIEVAFSSLAFGKATPQHDEFKMRATYLITISRMIYGEESKQGKGLAACAVWAFDRPALKPLPSGSFA